MWFKTVDSYFRLTGCMVAKAISSVAEYRASFLIQVGGMIINNFAWLLLWGIFFSRFQNVNGWHFQDSAVLFAIGALGGGIALFPAGLHRLSEKISQGELDTYLTLPRSSLWHAAFSRVAMATLGDISSAVLIFFLFAHISPGRLILFLATSVLVGLVLINFVVIVHSIGFWVGNFYDGADAMFNALIGFFMYPQSVFSGALKVMMLTVLPAFFIATVPVSVVQDFDFKGLGIVVLFWLASTVLASVVWRAGLKRYESGNLMNVRI